MGIFGGLKKIFNIGRRNSDVDIVRNVISNKDLYTDDKIGKKVTNEGLLKSVIKYNLDSEKKKKVNSKNVGIKDEISEYVTIEQEEDWITGFPLKTEYGYIKQIRVRDRNRYSKELNFLKYQGWQVQNQILKFLGDSIEREDAIDIFKRSDFITCVKNDYRNLGKTYAQIFNVFFIDDFTQENFFIMTQSEFDSLRDLILRLNTIPYRKVNPNREIDKYDRYKYLMAERKGQVIDFDTMFTTLMTKEGGGHKPCDILDFTMRQFTNAFKRVELIKGNETTTLFKTVDTNNKIEIVEWFKSTLKEDEKEKTYNSIDDIKKSNAFI